MNQDLIGRLHPLIVHLPIGFLVLAFVFELLSLTRKFKKNQKSVPVAVLFGFFAAMASLTTGLFLEDEGGYDDHLLFKHKLFAFITCGFSLTLLLLLAYQKNLEKGKRKVARILLFSMLMVALTITGHFGGSLTHGADYLNPESNTSVQITPVVKNPELVFDDIIQPVLAQKCYSCHSSKKQKGQLRLDGKEFILKGGKHGRILADEKQKSLLTQRINLPYDDEDHMPPTEKEQLTGLEIELITEWTKTGASFDAKVSDFNPALVKKLIESLSSRSQISWWPTDEIDAIPESAIQLLVEKGVRISNLSKTSNYVEIIFNSSAIRDAQTWSTIELIAANIASARFSFSEFDDEDLARLTKASDLRRLYLDHTQITNRSMPALKKFNHLSYLNLVGTQVSKEGLLELSDHPSLREIYIFDTDLKVSEVTEFSKSNPRIRIDTGRNFLISRPTDTIIYKPIVP
jgi:uncharacterized membrane protein